MPKKAQAAADHRLGVGLVAISSTIYGLAGVLTKSISADPLTVACWRGLLGGILIAAYVFWRRRGPGRESLRLGWRGWLMAVVGAVASVAFICAFKNTYVANVVIIYATVPFAAALLAWLLAGERLRKQTAVAAAASLAGVAIMVSSGLGGGHLYGDFLALVMTLSFALYVALIRKFGNTPAVWAGAVSSILVFAFGWFVTDPFSVTSRDVWLLGIFGATFAVASILWTEGARRIPAAESSLLGTAEIPSAIFFAWLLLSEVPPAASLAGGAVVLVAVFAHAGNDWLSARRAASVTEIGQKPEIA